MEGLLDAAMRLKDAQIECMPAIDCIMHYDSPETLFYVDPPYVMKARSGRGRKRYRYEMSDADHEQLAEVLHGIKGMAVLSGYQSELYTRLYSEWGRLDKTNTTNGNGSSVESLWISPAALTNREPLFRGEL